MTGILVVALPMAGVALAEEQAAPPSAVSSSSLRPLTNADWTVIKAIGSSRPLSEMSITNRLEQNDILSIADKVSVRNGLTNYFDGMCSGGARLSRDYVGLSSLVTVAFQWEESPQVTRFSFYGTNLAAAASWHSEMLHALTNRVGAGSVKVEAQPDGARNRTQPVRSETNSTSPGGGSRR